MAVTGYSIQALKNEVYAGGGNNDLAHYGQLWFGRNNCSLSEFISRSWWKSVYVGYGGSSFVNFSVPDRGGHDVALIPGSTQTVGGDEYGNGATTYYFDGAIYLTNTGAWNSFSYANITGFSSYNIGKGSFTWNGSYWQAAVAYPGPVYGATMFYAPT